MMRVTVTIICILVIASLVVTVISPYGAESGKVAAITLALPALLYCMVLLVLGEIERHQRTSISSTPPPSQYLQLASVSSPRVLAVAGGTLLLEGSLIMLGPHFLSGAALEGAYYVVLLASGVLLGLWCRSHGYVPLLLAIFLLLVLGAVSTILFLIDPDNRFQFGPEITLFAMWSLAARINLLPLDAVVLWSAWRISSATRGKPMIARAA